jgi:hypothetical protein
VKLDKFMNVVGEICGRGSALENRISVRVESRALNRVVVDLVYDHLCAGLGP